MSTAGTVSTAPPAGGQRASGSAQLPGVPRIYYAGEAAGYLEAVAEIGAEVAGLDWRLGLAAARRRLGAGMAVQGNLDPCALFGPKELIERRAREVLLEAKGVDTLPGPAALPPGRAPNRKALRALRMPPSGPLRATSSTSGTASFPRPPRTTRSSSSRRSGA